MPSDSNWNTAVVSFGNINLTADNGLYVRVLFGVFEKLLYAVHVAMICDGKRRHAQLAGPVKEVFYGRLPIQDGVLGVDMKMHKTHRDKYTTSPPYLCKKVINKD